MAPLLSIVIIGRNDNYMGNYLYRLQTCLCFLGYNLHNLHLLNKVEVVVVDWGSRSKISKNLELTPEASQIVRYVEVDEATTNEYENATGFFTTLAVNVGVRRSKGEYIMLADSDSMIHKHALKSLLSILGGEVPTRFKREETLYYIRRYPIAWEICKRKPSFKSWERIIELLSCELKPIAPGTTAFGGFAAAQLLHRSLWTELRGYSEALNKPWGWSDNDLTFRACQKYSWTDLSFYGVYAMHMEHWPKGIDQSSRDAHTINDMVINYKQAVNGEDWGLSNVVLNETTAKPVELKKSKLQNQELSPLQGTFNVTSKAKKLFTEDLKKRVVAALGNLAVYQFQAEAIHALSSYALHEYPLNFTCFNCDGEEYLKAILNLLPAIEVYLVNPWQEGNGSSFGRDPCYLSNLLSQNDYQGYSKIILGDIDDSVERLINDPMGPEQLELVFVNNIEGNAISPEFLKSLYEHLAPGGLIVYLMEFSDSKTSLKSWKYTESQSFLKRLISSEKSPKKTELEQHFPGCNIHMMPSSSVALISKKSEHA